MMEWRWFSGWTEAEMVPRLARARTLERNFPEVSGEMTLQGGWSQVRSESVLGREPPGRPVPGGLFERAQQVLETFDFSDPRIVAWHFSDEEPMQGRTVLLELRSLGQQLRYLCGVRVGGAREEHGEVCSIFGFSFETLQGHIEAGREWFLLKKDHASGEVRVPSPCSTITSIARHALVASVTGNIWSGGNQVLSTTCGLEGCSKILSFLSSVRIFSLMAS